KPILPANAPSRKKAGGPFIDPNPEEIITELGATHRLLVNKWDVSTNIENVPFKHFSIRLPNHADTKTAYEAYLRLLELSRETLARLGEGSRDYNVAMTADWITVIPRRSSEGPYGANAAGMLGIVYLPDQQEQDRWAQVGYTKQLEAFGIPVDA
ncbi:hypothetical protein D6D26_06818, partial [Aureobasidium pullulans]